MKLSTVLVLAPHTDDGEFGCGGSIARYIKKGARVVYVAFSSCEQSVASHLPKNILRKEVVEATKILGIAEDDCIVLNFEVRRFPQFRQEILDKMIELNNQYEPNIVLLPSTKDTHQDHQTINAEGFRAFKRTSMLGYEVPWNNLDFRTNCFIEISEESLMTKIKALKAYKSQKEKAYATEKFIRSLAHTRGVQIGKIYAEAFEVIRWII